MTSAYLSDTFLFYSPCDSAVREIVLEGEEFHHATRVLRLGTGDKLNITNGSGDIFSCVISSIEKNSIIASVNSFRNYENRFEKISICFPVLKSSERFEFAVEKCTELGITKFYFYAAENSPKFRIKSERIDKIFVSAMKQSLRAYLPEYHLLNNLSELGKYEKNRIVLDQKAEEGIIDFFPAADFSATIIIGTEAGFTSKELASIEPYKSLRINAARLRSETAAVTAASIISSKL